MSGLAGRAADALPLHVEVSGSGERVVLAHGFGGSARNFRPQVRALRGRYRTIVYDARGTRPQRRARGGRPTIHRIASSPISRACSTRRAPQRAVVGGLSMGAGVALRFALAHPRARAGAGAGVVPGAARGARASRRGPPAFARALDEEGLVAAGERFVWGEALGLSARDAALVRQGFLEHRPHALAHVLRELVAVQPAVEELAPALRAPRGRPR